MGIGANSAIYSVIDAALVRPVAFRDPGRLMMLWLGDSAEASFYTFSYPRFRYFQERARDFAGVAVYDDEIVSALGPGEPERLEGGRVSANFFRVLGVTPQLGRDFRDEEDRHGAAQVALLSDAYWRRRFQADRGVLGRSIRVDGDEVTIIGVLPPGVAFRGVPVDIWRSRIEDTRTFAPASVRLGAGYLTAIARLRRDLPPRQAQARFQAIDESYRRDHPGNSDLGSREHSGPLDREIFGSVRTPLLVLWGAVGCLLLIACSNVANLVLARALGRHREVAVRMALGASRGRIMRQTITEGVLLALFGAVASLPLADWSMRALVTIVRDTMSPIPDARLDLRVMAATFGIAAAIGIGFGVAPVLLFVRGNLETALHSGGRGSSASRWSIALRRGVVAAQVALCLVMLSAAALLAQGFLRMSTADTGLHTQNVVMLPLDLMPGRYETWGARGRFYDAVLRHAAAVPGVTSAAITSRVDVLQPGLGYMLRTEGAPDVPAGARGRSISPGYFGALGIPLLRGRAFDERDSLTAPRVMIVNEAFARHFFPGRDAIGKHVTYSTDRITCEIVGVVRDVRASLMEIAADQTMYLPLAQRPWLVSRLLVRTDVPAAVMPALRAAIQNVDREQAVAQPWILDDALASKLGERRSTMAMVAAFAVLALVLAAIGIYGVTRYTVVQRTREIGIRMALGADRTQIRSLIFRQSAQVLIAGLAVGAPLSIAAARLYRALLFQVRPADPATLAAVAAILAVVTLAASWLPAAHAARIDPVSSLRAE